MRIQKIHIENFGKLHDFDMELQDGLNTVRADNGWGKSTLAAFIKAMFYGLDYTTKRSLKENERKRYMPWQGGLFGGSLEFRTGKKAYRVERSFGAKDKEDTFALYDLSTGLESGDYPKCLGEELFHLDKAAFERSGFFAQHDVAAGINDSLNAALTHVEEDAADMQNYERAAASLENRMKYYRKLGNRGQIGKLEEELRGIRETLQDCRNQEKAAREWKERIAAGEQKEQELLADIRTLEAQIKNAQEYGEKSAKKGQHDLLKGQALEKEEQLRQAAAALGEYTSAPAGEKELDRCREMIYQTDTLRVQEEAARAEVRQAEEHIKMLEAEIEEQPGLHMGICVLAGFLAAAGALAVSLRWFVPGVLLLTAGTLAAFLEIRRRHQVQAQVKVLEEELASVSQELQEAEDIYDTFLEKRERLESRICRFLHVPEGTDAQKLETCWKLERQRSQEYGMRKQAYEASRREAQRSREAWLQFRQGFSEEELTAFLNLQEPEEEISEAQWKLERKRKLREELLKEQRDLHNQMKALEEKAEQIPELEEEEERTAGELEAAVKEHGLLEKTLKYLKAAREQFSVRYLKELQQGLLYYLKLLEPDYGQEPSMDVKLKLKIREAGASRDLDYFSAGWQDLFQIAERLSVVDALYKNEQPVLILDDPFVNLDTAKYKRAMELLEALSEKRQMIYFTCRT